MDNPSSPLDTLRQLKEMLDAGALTPTEFEALKQRLVFQEPATPPVPPVPPVAAAPTLPQEPPLPAPSTLPTATNFSPPAEVPTTAPVEPPTAPPFYTSVSGAAPVEPEPAFVPPVVRRAFEAETSLPPPSPPASFPVEVPAAEPAPEYNLVNAAYVADEFPETQAPAAKSPLALILSIGGLLALLSLVLYLSLNRRPSERISSTSLTPADTLAAPIETGPQAAELPATAAPETIRVAPANPAPVIQPRPAPPAHDSVAAPVTAPTDSAGGI
ncbi:SHOCT domain-containing protein [Hymenobacter sp. 5317J-9]|uniref:SHOCT domain-containing protein n=1 Tax=Hymenobacter sp. 5317J-9 TaxID=2932250 RepID=UPI001FD6704D|nr:SHOCT domain-containing protein [Hymenobacter sp. 5317J-9]UOQ98912.1 SHOCT domain-containing protein [Hymenobacter sp. 5317J-9]